MFLSTRSWVRDRLSVVPSLLAIVVLTGCGSSSTAQPAAASSLLTTPSSAVARLPAALAMSSSPAAAAVGPAAMRTRYPRTIDNCGQQMTFTKAPTRVLIMNGTSVGEVESFIMLGLQKSILANAQHYGVSDSPDMVAQINALPRGRLTNNDNFDVPAEQVLAAKPDLVVSTWSGGFESKSGFATRAQLTKAGIKSFVNPANCAFGKTDAGAGDKQAFDHRSMQSSLDFLTDLGKIFDVQSRAADLVSSLTAQIDAVKKKVAGIPKKNVLIAYPGMSMMNSDGLPAVFTGGIYDDIVAAAGAKNTFTGETEDMTAKLNKEQLASAKVDLLVLGIFTAQEKPDQEAAQLFAAYPQWPAAKTKSYIVVADSVYFGPLNALAVEKIAKAVHPDAGW